MAVMVSYMAKNFQQLRAGMSAEAKAVSEAEHRR